MFLLFDLDGVILDSEPLYDSFWNAQGERYDLGGNFASKIKGHTLSQIMNTVFNDFSIDDKKKIVAESIQFEETMDCPLVAGAKEFIAGIKLHDIKTALVTSSDDIKLSRIIKKFEMQKWFNTVVSANRVVNSKPNPEGYLLAASDLQADINECIVFEDSFAGIAAGKNAGMKVVALATTNTYQEIQATSNANMIIDNFTEFSYQKCLDILL